jgi:uncharacterized protein
MKLNGDLILHWAPLPFWLYFIAIALAEVLTIYLYPLVGVIIYSVILIAFIIESVFIPDTKQRKLVLALSLVPLVRILSLSMPLGLLSIVYRFPLIYLPLLSATIVVIWITGLKPIDVGLTFRYWHWQLLGGIVSGIAIGVIEYLIIRPSPLINSLSWQEVWLPALILIFTTGMVEELMFRGVLQNLSDALMGRQGIIYISLIFAVLHMGFYSWADVIFVFFVGLFFAAMVKRTGSLLGAVLSHGIANSVLFLVAPFILS